MGLFEDIGKPENIDEAVRLRLAQSLAHILSRAGDYLDVDTGRFEAALGQVRKYRQDPGVFARYYDLVFAINSNRFTEANQLIAEISDLAGQPVEFAILPYARDHLGDDYDRFPRLLFSEYSENNPMASPSGTTCAAHTENLHHAIDIISRVDKSIHEEIANLLVRIFVTTANTARPGKSYGGVTSFMVWGASFINVEAYKTQWETVQFLVHEITHSVLFGLSCDDPLVLNDPADSYGSPLRTESRPMDGIYHAMLVCARVATFNRMWMDSGLVPAKDRDSIEQSTVELIKRFQKGVATINRHGKLSEQGRYLFDTSCRALSVAA